MDINQRQGPNGIYIPLQEQNNSNPNIVVPPNPYLQPAAFQAPYNPQQVISNQPLPQVIYIDTSKLGTSPSFYTCPFCRNQITTEVKKKFNWFSCALCWWAGICCWAGLQFCRNKELNCNDAEHYCPICRNKIGDYSSC